MKAQHPGKSVQHGTGLSELIDAKNWTEMRWESLSAPLSRRFGEGPVVTISRQLLSI